MDFLSKKIWKYSEIHAFFLSMAELVIPAMRHQVCSNHGCFHLIVRKTIYIYNDFCLANRLLTVALNGEKILLET